MKDSSDNFATRLLQVAADSTDWSQYTALKPPELRTDNSHPAEIVDQNSDSLVLNYPWNSPQESFGVANGLALAALLTLGAAGAYLLIKSDCLKFVNFYIIDRHYKRLKVNLGTRAASKPASLPQTPRKESTQQSNGGVQSIHNLHFKLKEIQQPQKTKAEILAEFYSPASKLIQLCWTHLTQSKKRDSGQFQTDLVPASVLVAQSLLRILFIGISSLLMSLLFGHSKCLFSRTYKNYSAHCLNVWQQDDNIAFEAIAGGLVAALIVAPLSYLISKLVFDNFVGFASNFESVPLKEKTPKKTSMGSSKKQKKIKETMSVQSQMEATISDNESLATMGTQGHVSQSTAAQFMGNNSSERGLLNTSIASERSGFGLSRIAQLQAPNRQPAANELLQIEEDDDDLKVSPVKPKRARASNLKVFQESEKSKSQKSQKSNDSVFEIRAEPFNLNLNLVNTDQDNKMREPHSAKHRDAKDKPFDQDDPYQDVFDKYVNSHLVQRKKDFDENKVTSFQQVCDDYGLDSIQKPKSRNSVQNEFRSGGAGSDSTGAKIKEDSKVDYSQRQMSAQVQTRSCIKEPMVVSESQNIQSSVLSNFNLGQNFDTQPNEQLKTFRGEQEVKDPNVPNPLTIGVDAIESFINDEIISNAQESQKKSNLLTKVQNMILEGKHRKFLFIASTVLSIFGFVFTIYCCLNLTRSGFILYGATLGTTIVLDALFQAATVLTLTLKKNEKITEQVEIVQTLLPEKKSLMTQIFSEYEIPALEQIATEIKDSEPQDIERQTSNDMIKDYLIKKKTFKSKTGEEVVVSDTLYFAASAKMPQPPVLNPLQSPKVQSLESKQPIKGLDSLLKKKRTTELVQVNGSSIYDGPKPLKKRKSSVKKKKDAGAIFSENIENINLDNSFNDSDLKKDETPCDKGSGRRSHRSRILFSNSAQAQQFETPLTNNRRSRFEKPADASYVITNERSVSQAQQHDESELNNLIQQRNSKLLRSSSKPAGLESGNKNQMSSLKRFLEQASNNSKSASKLKMYEEKSVEMRDKNLNQSSRLSKHGSESRYSPVWDSIARQTQHLISKITEGADVNGFASISQIQPNQGLQSNSQMMRQKNGELLNRNLVDSKFDLEMAPQTNISSHRERSSKHKSFNSPGSIKKQFRELTAEKKFMDELASGSNSRKVGSKLDSSNTLHRRSNMMMQDDAQCSSLSWKFNLGPSGSLMDVSKGDKSGDSPLRNKASIQRASLKIHKEDSNMYSGEVQAYQAECDEADRKLRLEPTIPTPPDKAQKLVLNRKKSRRDEILVLKADSELDKSSCSNNLGSMLRGYNAKSELDKSNSPAQVNSNEKSIKAKPFVNREESALKKLVEASQRLISDSKENRQSSLGPGPSNEKGSPKQESAYFTAPFQLNKDKHERNVSDPATFQKTDTATDRKESSPEVNVMQTVATIKALEDFNKLTTDGVFSEVEQVKEEDEESPDMKPTHVRHRTNPTQNSLRSKTHNFRDQQKSNISLLAELEKTLEQDESKKSIRQSKKRLKSLNDDKENKNKDAYESRKRGKTTIAAKNRKHQKSVAFDNQSRRSKKSQITTSLKRIYDNSRACTASSKEMGSIEDAKSNYEEERLNKLMNEKTLKQRMEDQRRRLESFLSLARQSKSIKDQKLIKELIAEIDRTKKPLPMNRVNELKMLELMTSPYNQSLISMIKVEVDHVRKMKQLQKQEREKSALSLHKLTSSGDLKSQLKSQNSRRILEARYGASRSPSREGTSKETQKRKISPSKNALKDYYALKSNRSNTPQNLNDGVKSNLSSVMRVGFSNIGDNVVRKSGAGSSFGNSKQASIAKPPILNDLRSSFENKDGKSPLGSFPKSSLSFNVPDAFKFGPSIESRQSINSDGNNKQPSFKKQKSSKEIVASRQSSQRNLFY